MSNQAIVEHDATRAATDDATYRLLCERSAQIRLTLTPEQVAELSEQTGYEGQQLDLAVRLIQDCQIPRWYVWRGWPDHVRN